jgi:hypothetical protein
VAALGQSRITRDHRYTRNHPCPICGGYAQQPQHLGIRCRGFISPDDPNLALCYRVESDRPSKDGESWWHRLDGKIERPRPVARTREEMYFDQREGIFALPFEKQRQRRFIVRDLDNRLHATHVRVDLVTPDGAKEKRVWWDGGLKVDVETLPLYGTQELRNKPLGSQVVVTEGEPAADFLTAHDVLALATVTGADTIPVDEVLAVLRPFRVVLWPDADAPGERHMARIAQRLHSMGVAVQIVRWPEAPEGGDAADFFDGTAIGQTLEIRDYDSANFRTIELTELQREMREQLAKARSSWPALSRMRSQGRNVLQRATQANARLNLADDDQKVRIAGQEMLECRRRRAAYFDDAHHIIATPWSCGRQGCGACSPQRLWRSLRKKLPSHLPDLFTLMIMRSPDLQGPGSLRLMQKRLTNWRAVSGPKNCIYGLVYEKGLRPAVLMAIPADEAPAYITNPIFETEVILEHAQGVDVAHWWAVEAEREIVDAGEDFPTVFKEIKGRRRFQGVGSCRRFTPADEREEDSDTMESGAVPPIEKDMKGHCTVLLRLGHISGGNGKGKDGQKVKCPFCQKHMKRFKGTFDPEGFDFAGGYYVPKPGHELWSRLNHA